MPPKPTDKRFKDGPTEKSVKRQLKLAAEFGVAYPKTKPEPPFEVLNLFIKGVLNRDKSSD